MRGRIEVPEAKEIAKHPYFAALLELRDTEEFRMLYDPTECSHVWHVAAYVITDTGLCVFQQGRRGTMRTAGGCNFPNAVPRMINSMRLELMDELGIILTSDSLIRASPLYLLPEGRKTCTLLQVLLVKEKALGDLWSAEHARRRGHVPQDIEQATPDMRAAGNIVKKLSIENALGEACKKGAWRNCDLISLQELKKARAFKDILAPPVHPAEDGVPLQVISPTQKGGTQPSKAMYLLADVFNSPPLLPLRLAAQAPWKPILWDCAKPLNTVESIRKVAKIAKVPKTAEDVDDADEYEAEAEGIQAVAESRGGGAGDAEVAPPAPAATGAAGEAGGGQVEGEPVCGGSAELREVGVGGGSRASWRSHTAPNPTRPHTDPVREAHIVVG
eukprot:TRINITY_DN7447_c0_g1_i1.p1 TRINITY_DN7447_c0_g1~~TRINITY_DN7447_c0_g1_i1.p1  ORF type:complete len:388 (+),score=92.35 TRINITY_DN7447_c0_g1_i1:366-1529(+)